MRIAVSGANGFVGRHLLAAGRVAGLSMTALVRRAMPELPDAVVIRDLSAPADEAAAPFACDVFVHLAAAAGPAGPDAEQHFFTANVDGTRNALALAKASGAQRFIYLSSIKAVGERTLAGQPFDEMTVPAPEDAYGRSKLAAEALVTAQAEAGGIPAVILRPPLVYGPGAGGNFALLFSLAQKALPLPFASIDNRRSWVFVGNLVDAILAVAQAGVRDQAALLYHVADAAPCSTPALLRMIAAAADTPTRLFRMPPAILQFMGRLTGQSAKISRLCDNLEVDASQITRDGVWRPAIDTATAIRQSRPPSNQ
jgi:nucleoside-diphosphate-sugar epimerase